MKNKFLTLIDSNQTTNSIKIASGNIVSIELLYKETGKDRIIKFKGIVLAVRNKGINTSFIVRRILNGEGIELTLKINSPIIKNITIENSINKYKKSKLYYLRNVKNKDLKI